MTAFDITKCPLKRVATINDEALGEDTDPNFDLQYVDIGNVDSNGQIHEIANYRFEDAPSRARRRARDGDVIISTVRTYLQAIAPIESPPENLIVSTGFAVVRPKPELLDTGYCKYMLREATFLHEVVTRSVGVSYPAIKASDLGDIEIPIHSLSIQSSIATYLDRETTKLDKLITTKERLLELLTEKRRALITQTVTRGLNPNAPMRESGVEWLGKIPKHWEMGFARWLFKEIDERSEGGAEELLTVSHLTGVTSRAEKDVNMFMAESMEGYKVCQTGDLVINTLWAWMGAMGVAFRPGIVSPAYNVYRPLGQLEPRYIDYLVRMPTFAQEVTRYSQGVWSSRLRLYPEEFFKVILPVPSLEEQKHIADYIEQTTRKIDRLRRATEKTLDLLHERRTALIGAAVSGQLSIIG